MAATVGYVNIIKRSGKDGSRFPVMEDCLLGSGLHCEIRIHLDDVASEHCLIKCQEGGKCLLMNFDKQKPTKLNGIDVTEVAMLRHGDIISVSDRLFRWEYEEIPQISSVKKPTVTLPSNVTDDMGSSKRLVAVVSPQIRERHETSQSLRTWVLRRSVGNSLSSRSRQPTRTAEGRRSTSVVKIGTQDSGQFTASDNKTPNSVNISRRNSMKSSVKKSLLKVTPHPRKSGGVTTVETSGGQTPHNMKTIVHSSVPDSVETPASKTPRLKASSVSYSATPRLRKSKLIKVEKLSHSAVSLKKTPNAEETVKVSSSRRSYRKNSLGVSSSTESANPTPDVKFLGQQTADFSEVKVAQDPDTSVILDNKTPHSESISRRSSVKSSVKKSLLNLQKSGGISIVEPIVTETPLTVRSVVHGNASDLVETPVSKTPYLKNSSISYSGTPRSRKSKLTQMGKRSHSMASLKKTSNVQETVAVSSPRRSYKKDSLGVSSSVKSANTTPDVKFLGEQTPDFSLHRKMSPRYSHKVHVADTSATTVQSPDLFSSDQVSLTGEVITLKELQKSTPALTGRPKRKSAGLLLAHIRESQELFSRSRRNSTPSANTGKRNTRSARASMVVPKKTKLSFTPLSQSKTPRTLKSLRAMSAKAAKRRLTDVDLSEIAANELKAKSPKTPDKKKMAALLQCHKPRMLFSEVVKKTPVKKTPVKKNVVPKLPSMPLNRRRKVLRKPKVHTPRKVPVKGINSTGHIDSPETIIIHGKQSMALKRQILKHKEESESQKIKSESQKIIATGADQQAEVIETSLSVQKSSREMNTRKSVSFSPAPQVVAFAASRRISTRKSLKIPNISEETRGTVSPNSESSILETQPNRKTSILKKPSSIETHAELMEIDSTSSAITNLESHTSVVLSTPVRVSERQKRRTSSQSPSTPKATAKMGKSSITHPSPEALNTSIVSQASSTFDFDAVTTPCISVEKLVSPLNTSSSKKRTNSDSARYNVNISAQQIFKDLVADKVIDSSKWHDCDVNAATSTNDNSQWTDSGALAISSGRKSDRRSVSFPVNRYSTRKSQDKSTVEVYASSNKTVDELNPHEVAPSLQKNEVSVNISDGSFISRDVCADVHELVQLSSATVEQSPKLGRSSGKVHRISRQSVNIDVTAVEDTKKDVRQSKKSLPDDNSLGKGNVKRQSLSVRQRKSVANDLTDVRGVRRLFDTAKKQGSPLNDLTDVRGVKQLLKSPKQQKSPRNDLTDVKGVKQLLKTPRTQKSPQNDLTDVRGVKRLLRSSLKRTSPKNDLTDVRGVKRLLRSPLKQQKSPQNDLTDVRGVKRLFRSSEKQISPKNDLTDVRGVKRLLQSPRQLKSPQNDLTDVRGVKQLLEPSQPQKSPRNDLTDVRGVKQLLKSPKQQKSPANDLTDVRGVKELFRSSRKRVLPENDLTDVTGVKQLLRSPLSKKLKSPKNDLSDVMGVSSLFNSPQQEINKTLAVKKQEMSLTPREIQGIMVSDTQENKNAKAEQESTVPSGAKRRKYNLQEKETNSSNSEEMLPVNSYLTRGKRAKKEFINHPDVDDLRSIEKSKAVKDKLSQKNAIPLDDLEPESYKNTNPPRTRRGKVQVTVEGTIVSDGEKLNSDTANNLVQRDNTGQTSPNITNSPRTRRTRKQVVTEQLINDNLAASSDNASSPRILRGKKVAIKISKVSEEAESKSAVETENSVKTFEQKELFANPIQLPTLDTASPRTRRGRKEIVRNQKADGELQQLPDELQKAEQEGLKTRRGKKYIGKNKEQDEELKSVSHTHRLKPEIEIQNLPQNRQEIVSVNDSEPASLNESASPKLRGSKKGIVSKQQRSKAVTLLTDTNISDSKDSDTSSLKPQQRKVIFSNVIQTSSPSNSSSPRTRRGKKQIVSNEETDEQGLKANSQLLLDEQYKPLGTRSQRKVANMDNAKYSPSSIPDQIRTRRGRKIHTADVPKELKLPPRTQNLDRDERAATEELKQNNAGGVVIMTSSTVSPLKPRRGRKVGTVTSVFTADTKEKTETNNYLENNVVTAGPHTLDVVKNSTHDVPDKTSSRRTLRGKKQNATQVTGVSSDTSGTGERTGVKNTRRGRQNAVNLESESSVVSTDTVFSKDTASDSSPPKKSRRVRIGGDTEGKQSPHSGMMKPSRTETESTSDSIENRLHGLTHRTGQTMNSVASEIIDQPDEANEEKISSRRRGVRQHKRETNTNGEPEHERSTGETMQRSTRSKRKYVQETCEGSPKKKKKTQSDRLPDVSPEPKVVSPRVTRKLRNRCT